MRLGKPQQFMKRFEYLYPAFQKAFEPSRVRAADAAAVGEQTGLQGLDTDVARRGLSGSGAHLYGREGIRTGRQAMVSQAASMYDQQALQAALGEAGAGQRATQAAVGGIPMTPGAAPGWTGAADVGMNALALWLMSRGSK